jgi:hypothetical protein
MTGERWGAWTGGLTSGGLAGDLRRLMDTVFQWFAQSGHAAVVTAVLSVVALAVAIWSWRKSHRVQKRLLEIEQARETERLMHSRAARLTAKLIKEWTSDYPRYSLEIRNHGPAEAKEICVSLDGGPIVDHAELGPESSVRHLLTVTKDETGKTHKLQVTWSDDSGQPGIFRTTFAI